MFAVLLLPTNALLLLSVQDTNVCRLTNQRAPPHIGILSQAPEGGPSNVSQPLMEELHY